MNEQKAKFSPSTCMISGYVLSTYNVQFTRENVHPQVLYLLTLFYPFRKCALNKLKLYTLI